MPRLGPEPDVKRVTFIVRPKERGDVFTESAADSAVGQAVPVTRLDGSSTYGTVEGARLIDDGAGMALDLAVPGGIDRAPTPPPEEQPE